MVRSIGQSTGCLSKYEERFLSWEDGSVGEVLAKQKQGPGDVPQNPRLNMHTQKLDPVYILLIPVLERQNPGAHWPAHQD